MNPITVIDLTESNTPIDQFMSWIRKRADDVEESIVFGAPIGRVPWERTCRLRGAWSAYRLFGEECRPSIKYGNLDSPSYRRDWYAKRMTELCEEIESLRTSLADPAGLKTEWEWMVERGRLDAFTAIRDKLEESQKNDL